MKIRAVIFDMDGLMLDTEPLYRIAWKQASAQCGFDLTDEIYKQLVGRSKHDGFRALVNAFGPGFPLPEFQYRVQGRTANAFSNSPAAKKPGLDSLLAFLESRNIPMAVATSTERHKALPTLVSAGLLERFATVATGNEVARGKPCPDIFLLAAHRIGISPTECLVLEDAEAGVEAAHEAGMQVYMVPDLVTPSPAIKQLTQGIFASLTDVLRNLKYASIGSPEEVIDLLSFQTERLAALPLDRQDELELIEMHRNPAVMATLGGVRFQAEANLWLEDNLDHWDRHGFGIWIFREARGRGFVGRGGLREVEVGGGQEIELGYALMDHHWGMGFATEMAEAILKIGFERFRFKSIVALIAAENSRSRRVAEKTGFQLERNVIWKGLPAGLYRLTRAPGAAPLGSSRVGVF